MVLARMASYGCAQWGVAAQWLPKCCPDTAPRPLQLVESYDTSNPMLVEALRRHDAASRSQARWRPRAREALRTGQAGRGFFRNSNLLRNARVAKPREAWRELSRGCFLGPNVAPSREGAAICAAARSRGDTHRREPAVAFLFEFVAALQGLPLSRTSSTELQGCHLLSYSSVRDPPPQNQATPVVWSSAVQSRRCSNA